MSIKIKHIEYIIIIFILTGIFFINSSYGGAEKEANINKNNLAFIERDVESLSDQDSLKVLKAIESILARGEHAIPLLLKFAKKEYNNDFNHVAPVYIPFYSSDRDSRSIVINGKFFTPSALSIYLIESIRKNKAVHSTDMLEFDIDFDHTEYSNINKLSKEKFKYEFVMSAAIERYEQWWKLKNDKKLFKNYIIWPWESDVSIGSLKFAPLDFEILRSKLRHSKITDDKWNNSSDKDKCRMLYIYSILRSKQ